MAILTENDGRFLVVAGHYVLALQREGATALVPVAFKTLDALAQEALHVTRLHCGWRHSSEYVVGALSSNGKFLDLADLVKFGSRLRNEQWAAHRFEGYRHRSGPVPGIRCHRASSRYSRRYMRRIETTSERRQAASVLPCEGEVPARAARNASNLPDTRDEAWRLVERSWKSQHKGRKAWDRVA